MMSSQLLSGRYQLQKTLGSGGMSQTYLAKDMQRPGNPDCVVKQLKPLSQSPELLGAARVLFNREADTLEKLGDHDQIPRLLAHFEQDQEFYLVEEYIEGEALVAELRPGQRWSESEVIQLLLELLPVLDYIHRHHVIHRDIKPANIIRRRQDRRLVLIDFGAVRQVHTNLTITDPVRAGTVVGTQGYMPTEQAHGAPRMNSDLYALGMVCIQALTGLLPSQIPQDATTGELLWQHFIPVSRDIELILTKMVRYHFKDRYQSAAEALQMVQQVDRKRQALAAAPARPNFLKTRKSWMQVGAGVAIVAGICAGTFLRFPFPSIARPVPPGTLAGDQTLDVGILTTSQNPQEGYTPLTTYLQSELQQRWGSQVKVKFHFIDVTQEKALERAKQEIKAKKWELAFTTAPLLSATAVSNDFTFAARMFPDIPQFESVLFVRNDSPIQSLDDLNANTTIALGDFNNASGFYQPVYDLYGKTLRVNLNNTTAQSIDKVRSQTVDVGAGASILVEKESDLRVIHESRALPLSGVYLAPTLTEAEQQGITEVLLKAPTPLQKDAKYAKGNPVDYTEFLKIKQQVEEITRCTDWEQNPVKLFPCEETNTVAKGAGASADTIVGKTQGYSIFEDTIHFKLQGQDGTNYRLIVPRTVLEQDPNLNAPAALNFKTVEVKQVDPVQNKGVAELRITAPGQLVVVS